MRSIFERHKFSNWFHLFPIRQIDIHTDGITFHQKGKGKRYKWSEITSAKILTQRSVVGFLAHHYKQRVLTITTENKQYKFEVSNQFFDFYNSRKLVDLIKQNMSVIEEHKKESWKDKALDAWIFWGSAGLIIWLLMRIAA